jgi:23S rRNA U2552 (ribose-2'-O)-methylase RlmE/FtsJ
MQQEMAAAGVTLRSADSGDSTHIIDAVLATERWHTHVWEPSEAPELLHWSGRPAFDAESTRTMASRAWYKIDELLRNQAFCLQAGSICVDVGAAPGGWSARLSAELVRLEAGGPSTACGHVFAIDPGALTLEPMPPNVTHLQLKAERAVESVQEALLYRFGDRSPDWVVCDANCTPSLAAQLALPFVSPATAGVVITMKRFASNTAQHEADVADCLAAVHAKGLVAHKIHHLLSNGRDERTLVATRV